MNTDNPKKSFQDLAKSENPRDIFNAFVMLAKAGPEVLAEADKTGLVPALLGRFKARLSACDEVFDFHHELYMHYREVIDARTGSNRSDSPATGPLGVLPFAEAITLRHIDILRAANNKTEAPVRALRTTANLYPDGSEQSKAAIAVLVSIGEGCSSHYESTRAFEFFESAAMYETKIGNKEEAVRIRGLTKAPSFKLAELLGNENPTEVLASLKVPAGAGAEKPGM